MDLQKMLHLRNVNVKRPTSLLGRLIEYCWMSTYAFISISNNFQLLLNSIDTPFTQVWLLDKLSALRPWAKAMETEVAFPSKNAKKNTYQYFEESDNFFEGLIQQSLEIAIRECKMREYTGLPSESWKTTLMDTLDGLLGVHDHF